MEVLLQSLPQTILAAYMYRYLQANPPSQDMDVANSTFSSEAVAQALTASVLNILWNGTNLYIASKISGRPFFSYLLLTFQFEGSAELPPAWEDKTTSAHTVIEGNYSDLKIAQQMKILQTVLRRDVILLCTSDMMAHPDANHIPKTPTGAIVLEHRKVCQKSGILRTDNCLNLLRVSSSRFRLDDVE